MAKRYWIVHVDLVIIHGHDGPRPAVFVHLRSSLGPGP